jgi:opacity protein-like surface antigen
MKTPTRSSLSLFLTLLGLSVAPVGEGQSRRGLLEIDPLVGYSTWGQVEEGRLEGVPYRIDAAEQASYGLRLGYGLTESFQLEVEVSRSETELLIEEFGFPAASFHDLTLESVLAYGTYHLTRSRIAPYVTVGAGVTHLESAVVSFYCPREHACIASVDRLVPEVFVPHQETRPVAAAGVGVKAALADHLGLRLDARGYAIEQGDTTFVQNIEPTGERRDWLTSGTVSAGLLFSF